MRPTEREPVASIRKNETIYSWRVIFVAAVEHVLRPTRNRAAGRFRASAPTGSSNFFQSYPKTQWWQGVWRNCSPRFDLTHRPPNCGKYAWRNFQSRKFLRHYSRARSSHHPPNPVHVAGWIGWGQDILPSFLLTRGPVLLPSSLDRWHWPLHPPPRTGFRPRGGSSVASSAYWCGQGPC